MSPSPATATWCSVHCRCTAETNKRPTGRHMHSLTRRDATQHGGVTVRSCASQLHNMTLHTSPLGRTRPHTETYCGTETLVRPEPTLVSSPAWKKGELCSPQPERRGKQNVFHQPSSCVSSSLFSFHHPHVLPLVSSPPRRN